MLNLVVIESLESQIQDFGFNPNIRTLSETLPGSRQMEGGLTYHARNEDGAEKQTNLQRTHHKPGNKDAEGDMFNQTMLTSLPHYMPAVRRIFDAAQIIATRVFVCSVVPLNNLLI